MNSTSLRIGTTAAVLAIALLLHGTSVHADARRAGLAGTLLIEDRADIYFFPQRLTEHPNVIELSYGGNAATGTALLTLGGDSSVFAIALHRGDAQRPHVISDLGALAGPSSVFGPPFTLSPATVVDLLYGVRLGGGELGLRLSLGHAQQSSTNNDLDSGTSDTFVTAEVGYGWGERGRSTRVDLSAALSLDFANQQVANMDTDSGNYFGISALVRAFMPLEQALDLGVLGTAGVSRSAIVAEMIPGDPAASDFAFNLGGGIGPALNFGRVSLAAYALINLRLSNQDPDSELESDDSSSHALLVPGVHMAVEVPLNDWLFVRTGAQYSFNWRGTSAPGDSGTSQNDGSFGWNAGLGVAIDQFRFDGSLQQGFVTGGPDFIGGTGGGFLAMATLSYSFDHLRGRHPETPPPQFTPTLPPEEAPPPPAEPGPEAPASAGPPPVQ